MYKSVCVLGMILLTGLLSVTAAQQPNIGAESHGIIRLQRDETLFDADRERLLSYRNPELVLRLTYQKKNLAIDIEGSSQSRGRIELPPEIVQVNEIRATPSGQAIVIGMVSGSVFEVVIFNTRSIGITDSFLAYSPSVSPDGRFIAFVKFYPAHFVEGTDDHYLLYDSSRSAVENRLTREAKNDHANVGIPVYPHVPNQDGNNTKIPEQHQHHMLAQKFFWQSDSTRYAFVDDYAGEWNLLVVSTLDAAPTARKITVPKNEVCAPLHKEGCQVTLAGTELTPGGLLASFRGIGADSALEQVIEYSYQQFSLAQ